MPRVALAGLLHESNTFLAVPTTVANFEAASLTRGPAVMERWRKAHHELGGLISGAEAEDLKVVPLLATFAVPSGTITAEAFETLAGEIVSRLRDALPVDGVLLALHGATCSEQFPDADGEILRRVREAVGPSVPVITTLDLHANISPLMAASGDAIVTYRSNPHLDQRERGLEAARMMARTLRGEVRPVMAMEAPPMLINIGRQLTSAQPARALYEDLEQVLTWPGILSASIGLGFYYSDVEEMGMTFIAVADGDHDLADKAAKWMARRAWDRRAELQLTLPGPEETVRAAVESGKAPVVLMDVGDNVGGGSPGDSTLVFAEMMRQNVPNTLTVLADPQAVEACVKAGVRATVRLAVGGKTDQRHGAPVEIEGRVRAITDGVFVETQVRHGGWGGGDQGVTAVVETAAEQTVILTSRRMAPMSLEQVISTGVHPERKRLIIAKGVIAPRAAYEPIAAEIMMVDTPGSTSGDPNNFDFKRRRRPLYPLELDATY